MANPAAAQARVAFGTQAGRTSAWTDFRFRSESLGLDFPTIEDDSIRAFGEQEQGLPSKIRVNGALPVNWQGEDHEKFIANFFGHGATPSESPTGVWTKKYAVQESDVDYISLWLEISRDLGRPELLVGAEVQQLQFSIAAATILNGSIQVFAPRAMFWGDAAEVVVTGTPNAPILRGIHDYAGLQLADPDIFVKVSSVGSDVVTFQTKVGTAAAYSNSQGPLATGNDSDGNPIWHNLEDEAGVLIGDEGLPVQIHFPDDTLTAADEWEFTGTRAVWSQSLPTHSPFNEIYAEVYVDGTIFRTRDLGLTLERPIEPDDAIGGRFVDTVIEQGQRTAVWTLTRRASNLALYDKLLRAESATVRLQAYGALIGATGVRRQLIIRSLNCIPEGRGPNVAGRDTLDEQITLRAHPSTDGTYPSAVTIETVNSVEDIAA